MLSIVVCQILAEGEGLWHRFLFLCDRYTYVIRKMTFCDLLTFGAVRVWQLKVGQWEEAERCRVADCVYPYLLKLAPQ